MPKTGRKIYLVLGFRYASLENVVPIGVFSSHDKALNAAHKHREYRGGKYDHRIYEFVIDKLDDDVGHKVNTKQCLAEIEPDFWS
jgi:hypothetical protein